MPFEGGQRKIPAWTLATAWGLTVLGLGAARTGGWSANLPAMLDAWVQSSPQSWGVFGMAIGFHLLALLGVAGALGAGWAIGIGPARLLCLHTLPRGTALVRTALGFIVVAGLQQGLGYSGLLFPGLMRVELALLALFGIVSVIRGRKHLRPRMDGPVPWIPLVLLSTALLMSFLLGRIPDPQEDALNYHFAAPEHYLLLHRINAEPWHLMFHMPLGFEMLLTLAFPAGGMTGCSTVVFASVLLATAAVFRLGVIAGGNAMAGWWSAALFAACGLVAGISWQGKNDIAAAGALVMAAWLALERLPGRGRPLAASALLAGCALAMKFPSGFAVAALAACVLAASHPRATRLPGLALAGILPLSGWLAGNWLFLGNPVHPFLSGLFPDIAWNPAMQEALWRTEEAYREPGSAALGDLGRGAWRVFGSPFHGSLALAGLLPFALFAARRGPAALLAYALALAYLLWMPSQRNPRFLFPAVAWAAALAGAYAGGLRGVAARGRDALAICSLAAFLAGTSWYLSPKGWLTLSGRISGKDFASSRFTTWEAVRRWTHNALPETAYIRMTGDERRVGFRGRIMGHHVVTEPFFWRLTRDSLTPAEVRKKVRQAGLTHHLHNFVLAESRQPLLYGGPPWSARQLALYRDFVSGYYRPVYSPPAVDLKNGGFWAFEISPRPLPSGRPVYFLPFSEDMLTGAWRLMKEGRSGEAAVEARRILGLMPDVMQAQLALGTVLSGAGDWKGTMKTLEPGVRAGFISLWEGSNLGTYGAAAANAKALDEGVRWSARSARIFHGAGQPGNSLGLALIMRGQEMARAGRRESGIRDIEAALPLLTDPAMATQVRNLLYHLKRP